MNPQTPFITGPASLRVQSVLYRNEESHVRRALESLDRAAHIAIACGTLSSVVLAYGDCSPVPVLDRTSLKRLQETTTIERIDYTFFKCNFGSARGHNSLHKGASENLTLIMNPDVVLAPNALVELVRPLRRPGAGLAEARQVPIEHPKEYDQVTGQTSWAATACALTPTRILRELGGFDSDTFFLYGDDVDFSWRVRLMGLDVIFQPSAIAFHDKRLSLSGTWVAGDAERYYSAEASLLLTYKWSRADLTERYLTQFRRSGMSYFIRAAESFERRRREGRLPEPLDPSHQVGQFIGLNYADHRYTI